MKVFILLYASYHNSPKYASLLFILFSLSRNIILTRIESKFAHVYMKKGVGRFSIFKFYIALFFVHVDKR
jgi:hypothetical protein